MSDDKEAFERLSSVEEFEQALVLKESRQWIILIVLLALIVSLIIWSFVGRIPTEVNGRGVLLNPEGVFLAESKATGVVTKIYVNEGDTLTTKAPLVKIHNPLLQSLLSSIESSKYKLEKDYIELALLENIYNINQDLYEKGLVAKINLDNSERDILKKEVDIEETKTAIVSFYSDLEKASPNLHAKEIIEKAFPKVEMTSRIAIDRLEDELAVVTSPSNGRVLEVLVNVGEVVHEKEPLVWLEHPDQENELNVFYSAVSPDTLGRIEVGMKAIIEPNNVSPREYGAIIGTIKAVFPYPISKNELMQTVGNSQIADYLMEDSPAILNVIVEPEVDLATRSGFKWTSKKGPPFEVPAGTVCKIRLIVDEQPPISYLIPLWRIKST